MRKSVLKAQICAVLLAFTSLAATRATLPNNFPTPEAAFAAFQAAVKASDLKALETMLGPKGKDLISSGDQLADANARTALAAAFDARHSVTMIGDGHAVLKVGREQWEMPIPVIKSGTSWRFDVATARDEILNRRVGKNETSAMAAAYAYVDAQREYASRDRGDGALSYAQRFSSSTGHKDGLYWPAKPGEPESPLGPAFAPATPTDPAVSAPYHGYVFRIMRGQGPNAPGGRLSYMINERMVGGHALIAYPAVYGVSGVMTFIINNEATLYQKDLGPNTAQLAAAMTAFNPDATWAPAK